MNKYNKLTEKLLAEGYTVENHPDYVMVGSGAFGENKLENYEGGFVYYGWYAFEKTYKTPCGMLLKGNFAHCGLSWRGNEYRYENDNPFIICPKDEADCPLRDEPFKSMGTGVLKYHCIVHETNEPYIYEGSCEAALKLKDDQIRRERISFELEKNHHVCENHMRYDKEMGGWIFNYNPMSCVNGFCRAQTTDFKDGGGCPVLNKYISKDKGNVYYDVRYWGRDYSKDGTLFEGEQFETIIKGKQLFNKPIRLDIAKVIANVCKDEIRLRVRWNTHDYDSLTFFRAERGEIDFHWEVINIRAEKKRVRDLEQDLQDIADGIQVIHEIDAQKKKKDDKRKRTALAKQKRIDRLKTEIIKRGWDDMEVIEQNKACKYLSFEEIDELDARHYEEMQNAKAQPQQMSIFDYMEG